MWLWIDVLIAYLIRVLIRATKLLRGHSWPASKATLMSAIVEGKNGAVYYKYSVDGENYADVDVKPFLWPGSAEIYVRKFRREDELTVRVKPGHPSVSVFDGPRNHGNSKR
jgi:hypothetical protein